MNRNVGLSQLREWHSVFRKHVGDIGEAANFHVSRERITVHVIVGCDGLGLGVVIVWVGLRDSLSLGTRRVSVRKAYRYVSWSRCLE